jgi:hypothetical protein
LAVAFETAPGRFEIALAAAKPSVAGHDELLPRHIVGVERDAESLTQLGAELGVGEDPARRGRIPVFDYLVVAVHARGEVPGEAAAGSRGDAVGLQRGDRDEGEVAAASSQSLGWGTRFEERSRIGCKDAVEDLAGPAKVAGRRLNRPRLVNQDSPNGGK